MLLDLFVNWYNKFGTIGMFEMVNMMPDPGIRISIYLQKSVLISFIKNQKKVGFLYEIQFSKFGEKTK
jgi:hypothetical protein